MQTRDVQNLWEESYLLGMFGILLTCGDDILGAILKVRDAASEQFKAAFQAIHDGVRGGGSIANGMRACEGDHERVFSSFVPNFIDISEEVGDVDKALIRVSGLLAKMAMLRHLGCEPIDASTMLDYEMLAMMVEADLPIFRSVRILQNVSSRRGAWKGVGDGIEQGKKLSEALATFPNDFPPHVVAMIAVGENTKTLDVAFSRLAAFHEQLTFGI